MKHNRCYICYEATSEKSHFHPTCLKKLFGDDQLPKIDFNNKEIESMAFELIKQKKAYQGFRKNYLSH